MNPASPEEGIPDVITQSTAELEEKIGNKYSLCIVAARRARQLKAGYQPLIKSNAPNYLTVAMEEIAADLVVGMEPEEMPVEAATPEPSLTELLVGAEGLHTEGEKNGDEKLINLEEELAQASAALGALEEEDKDKDSDEIKPTVDKTEGDDDAADEDEDQKEDGSEKTADSDTEGDEA